MAEFDGSVQALLERPPFAPRPVEELRAAHMAGARRAATTALLGILVVALVTTFAATGTATTRRQWSRVDRHPVGSSAPSSRPAPVRPTSPSARARYGFRDSTSCASSIRTTTPSRAPTPSPAPATTDRSRWRSIGVDHRHRHRHAHADQRRRRDRHGDRRHATKTIATTDRLWVVRGNGDHETLTAVDPASMTAGRPSQLDERRPSPASPLVMTSSTSPTDRG